MSTKEIKLDKIIFKYLDMELSGIEKKKGKYYNVVFSFPGEKYGILGWDKNGNLYVNYELTNKIEYLFGLEESDSLEVIGRYVGNRYNLEVKNTWIVSNNWSVIVGNRYNLEVKNTTPFFIINYLSI